MFDMLRTTWRATPLYDITGAAWLAWYEHRATVLACLAVLATTLAMMLAPQYAYAGFLDDAWSAISGGADAVSHFFDAIVHAPDYLMTTASVIMKSINTGQLTNDFTNLFQGKNGNGLSAYDIAKDIHGTVLRGVGYCVLVIVYLVQMGRIANRFQQNGVMPQVKEVMFLLVEFVLIKYLIDNSFDFCNAVYTVFNEMIKQLPGWDGTSAADTNVFDRGTDYTKFFENSAASEEQQEVAAGGTMALEGTNNYVVQLILAGFVFLGSLITIVIAYFVVYARALQIYVLAMFAPIPLACLGMDETRQWGVGYIKNFIAISLAGVIIAVIIVLWPMLVASCVPHGFTTVAQIPQIIGLEALLCYSLVKTGSWARDILGG